MAEYKLVAEGHVFEDLRATIANMELPKGAKVRVEMDFKVPGVGRAFDLPGAEWIFRTMVPDGVDLIDVYGEGSKGIVEMESDPVWLLPMILFIQSNWVAIVIAGFTLGLVVTMIRIFAAIPVGADFPWQWVIIGGVALVILTQMPRKPAVARRKAS